MIRQVVLMQGLWPQLMCIAGPTVSAQARGRDEFVFAAAGCRFAIGGPQKHTPKVGPQQP